jgi:hypothetical protein
MHARLDAPRRPATSSRKEYLVFDRKTRRDRAQTNRIPRRFTVERIAIAIALFMSLSGGTALAASKLITGHQIAKGTITSRNIKSHSLVSSDFKPGQLPGGARGPAGPSGPSGPPGERGPQGPAGTAAASGIVEVDTSSGNAEWQQGTNHGFPANPVRKRAGEYCIPLPAGVDGDTVAPVVTADGTPSIDVVRTATDCADTEHWLEVDVYGPIILDGVNPTTYGIAAATQDFAFDVVIP